MGEEKKREFTENEKGAIKRAGMVLCGGSAGAFAKTATSPLERVRIMTQTGSSSKGALGTMGDIFRKEGVKGFWRGNFANVVRIVPHKGVLFMSNDSYKKLMARVSGHELRVLFMSNDSYKKLMARVSGHELTNLPSGWAFVSGSMAGISATMATYPLDVVRTRLAGLHAEGRSSSIVGTFVNAVRSEGARALFQGITPTILGSIPYEGIKFGFYDVFKKILKPYNSYFVWKGGDGTIIMSVLSGALAATVAGMVIYPNDTIRRLMQIEGEGGAERKYKSLRHCWSATYKEHGVPRFYRGLPTYIVRMIPNAAIQFATYEYLKERLNLVL